jgi:hypothetical protein
MRYSIASAVVVFLIGMISAWWQSHLLGEVRDEFARLEAATSAHGWAMLRPGSSEQKKALRNENRLRSDVVARQASARTDEFIHGLRCQEGLPHDGALSPTEWKRQIQSMNPDILERIATELPHDPEIADEVKGMVLACALSRWAEMSPESALSWWRECAGPHTVAIEKEARRGLLFGLALHDPERAFQVVEELAPDDPARAMRVIVAACFESNPTSEAFVTSLRAHLETVTDAKSRAELGAAAFDSWAHHLLPNGFEESVDCLQRADLSAEEKEQFSSGLSYFGSKGETGRWMDWVSENLADERAVPPVYALMSEWTQKDHQAAGRWLLAAKEGPAKTTATRAYATAVAPFEPAVAAQWAMTLPVGPERDSTLRLIWQHWPSADPEGADTFAREHGIP